MTLIALMTPPEQRNKCIWPQCQVILLHLMSYYKVAVFEQKRVHDCIRVPSTSFDVTYYLHVICTLLSVMGMVLWYTIIFFIKNPFTNGLLSCTYVRQVVLQKFENVDVRGLKHKSQTTIHTYIIKVLLYVYTTVYIKQLHAYFFLSDLRHITKQICVEFGIRFFLFSR